VTGKQRDIPTIAEPIGLAGPDTVYVSPTDGIARCGNLRHPAGPWHEATPLPYSWRWLERFRQWRNKRRWGCRCHARPPVDIPHRGD